MRYILFLTILMFGCDSTERERDRVEMTDAASMDARAGRWITRFGDCR